MRALPTRWKKGCRGPCVASMMGLVLLGFLAFGITVSGGTAIEEEPHKGQARHHHGWAVAEEWRRWTVRASVYGVG